LQLGQVDISNTWIVSRGSATDFDSVFWARSNTAASSPSERRRTCAVPMTSPDNNPPGPLVRANVRWSKGRKKVRISFLEKVIETWIDQTLFRIKDKTPVWQTTPNTPQFQLQPHLLESMHTWDQGHKSKTEQRALPTRHRQSTTHADYDQAHRATAEGWSEIWNKFGKKKQQDNTIWEQR
jgi:hypothetical protein